MDDGSRDATPLLARRSGAQVVGWRRRQGKAAALREGSRRARGSVLVFLDADLGSSAARCSPLVEAVRCGEADMAVAVFPRVPGQRGWGLAVGLARWGVARWGGRVLQAPLSGQRAVRRPLLEAVSWWGRGWGVEVALDLAALQGGWRIVEIPLELEHRHTGRSLAGFLHRGSQFRDIAWTLAEWPLRGGRGTKRGTRA